MIKYMTKEEIILNLLFTLNKGNCGTIADRPYYAIEQYNRLVAKGIITEDETSEPSVEDINKYFHTSAELLKGE